MARQIDNAYWQLVWERFKQGDQLAFQTLYEEFQPSLFAYGSRLTSNRELLKDSVQDLFINLFNYKENLSSPVHLEHYLFRSLKRIIFRKLVEKDRFSSVQEIPQINDLILSIEQEAFTENEKERLEELRSAISSLESAEKELLFLKFNSGLTYKEIGKLLGIKPNTLQKQVYVILKQIREKVSSSIMVLFASVIKHKK